MKTFNTKSDIRCLVGAQFECIFDSSCYELEFDELIDHATDKLVEIWRDHGFKYGDMIPEINDSIDYFELIEGC